MGNKKIISILVFLALVLGTLCTAAPVLAEMPPAPGTLAPPGQARELKVSGNKLVYADDPDTLVTLRGVNIPSLQWGKGESLDESIRTACDDWNSNYIRININPSTYLDPANETYRNTIYRMVDTIALRGKYVDFDCHTYRVPNEKATQFWDAVSKDPKYANNPAVLFGLCNEPHGIKGYGEDENRSAWDLWKNGGQVYDDGGGITTSLGHQGLVDMIRANGANNICIAGGMDYAFQLGEIANDKGFTEYALTDPSGNGIMYDTHIYPTKGYRLDWIRHLGNVRKVAPIMVGEFGMDQYDPYVNGKATGNGKFTPAPIFMNTMLDWFNDSENEYGGVPLHWTAFALHPTATPRLIRGWNFEPTNYLGKYILDQLRIYQPDQSYDNVYQEDFTSAGAFSVKADNMTADDTKGSLILKKIKADKAGSTVLHLPIDWIMSGTQTLELEVRAQTEQTSQIGFYGADLELWTKEVALKSGSNRISISVDELKRTSDGLGDGVLSGAIQGIYLAVGAEAEGSLNIGHVAVTTSSSPTLSAPEMLRPQGNDAVLDMETARFQKTNKVNQGNTISNPIYAAPGVNLATGADDLSGQSIQIPYTYRSGNPGYVEYWFPDGFLSGAVDVKYFSFCMKMQEGRQQTLDLFLAETGTDEDGNFKITRKYADRHATGDTTRINTQDGEDGWIQFIYNLDDFGLINPQNINYMRIYVGKAAESFTDIMMLDEVKFTNEYPALLKPRKEETALCTFEETAALPWRIMGGGGGNSISGSKCSVGYASPSSYRLDFVQTTGEPQTACAFVDDANFKKINTAWSNTARGDYLVFYARSVTGHSAKLNLAMRIAVPSDPKREKFQAQTSISHPVQIGAAWTKIVIPIAEFKFKWDEYPRDVLYDFTRCLISDVLFSAAEDNTQGSIIIDNLAISNIEDITLPDYSGSYDLLTADTDIFNKEWIVEKAAGKEGGITVTRREDGGYGGSSPALEFAINSGVTGTTPDFAAVMENCVPSDYDLSGTAYFSAVVKGGAPYLSDNNANSKTAAYQTTKMTAEFWSNHTDLSKPKVEFIEGFTWGNPSNGAKAELAKNAGMNGGDAMRLTIPLNGSIEAIIPQDWDLSQLNENAWISFWINPAVKDTSFNTKVFNREGTEIKSDYTHKANTGWRKICYRYSDLSNAGAIQLNITGLFNNAPSIECLIDGLTISNQDLLPELVAKAEFDVSANTWSSVYAPLTFFGGSVTEVKTVKFYSPNHLVTPEGRQDASVTISEIKLTGYQPEERFAPDGDFIYEARLDGDGAMDFGGGYWGSVEKDHLKDYFIRHLDKVTGNNSPGGLQVQYDMAAMPNTGNGTPYLEAPLPLSWDLSRTDTLSFDVKLTGKGEGTNLNGWITKPKSFVQNMTKIYSVDTPENWEDGLSPVFAFADQFGNLYQAKIPMEYSGNWETVSVPLSAFRDSNGETPDYSHIVSIRLYPDPDKQAGGLLLDNFKFTSEHPEVKVQSIQISTEDDTTIKSADAAVQFSAEVLPVEADNQKLVWTVDQPAVAAISESGLLTVVDENAQYKSVAVTATNIRSGLASNPVTVNIDIYNGDPYAVMGVNPAASTVTVIKDTDAPAVLVVALYQTAGNGERILVHTACQDITEQVGPANRQQEVEVSGAFVTEDGAAYDTAYVYLWNGLDAMQPLCEPYLVNVTAAMNS